MTFVSLPEDQEKRLLAATRALRLGRGEKQTPFRKDLERARRRFKRSSAIDLRGCRIGSNQDYLRAVQRFFSAPSQRPKVSASKWFQFFAQPTWEFIDVEFGHGREDELAKNQAVRDAVNHWITVAKAKAPGSPPLRDFLHFWNSANPSVRLRTYLNEGLVLPVVENKKVTLYVRSDAASREPAEVTKGATRATTFWLNNQWSEVSGRQATAAEALRKKWQATHGARAPILIGVTEGEDLTKAFVAPDDAYMEQIAEV